MNPRPWGWSAILVSALVSALAGCASAAAQPAGGGDVAVLRHVDRVENASASVPLAGTRCQGRSGSCLCRTMSPDDDAEASPPPAGRKRFEIRIAADGGTANLESATLGRFQATGPQEACFYVDVEPGASADFAFVARADVPDRGIAPRLRIAEYGPKGPWWYDIVAVDCVGQLGRCDRQGVDAWSARTVKHRKRGRLEPCGSAVVTGLAWDTSGGQHERDGGLFRDLTVHFGMEVKKFATQFAPGSTECVPK